jgi:transposase InsO family protein
VQIFHSDNGGEFISKTMQAKIKEMDATFIHGSPRHPQSQGVVERVNGTLKKKLDAHMNSHKGAWSSYLDVVTKHYNTTYHSTIGMTPYKVNYYKLDLTFRQKMGMNVEMI